MRNENETVETLEGKKSKRPWSPPRGIRLFEISYRQESPYAVQWRVTVGSRRVLKTKNFPTKEAQIAFAQDRAREMREFGSSAATLDPEADRAHDLGPPLMRV